jgi:outer membrane receptor protein involved in Fe transport
VLGAVVSSSVETIVRHRLAGGWDAMWTAGFANNDGLMPTFFRGGYRSLTAGVGLQRSLTEKLSLGVRYDFVRQTGAGNYHGSGTLTAISGLSSSLIGSARPV